MKSSFALLEPMIRAALKLFLALALVLCALPVDAESRPPNFVFILVDDLGADQIGSYGNATNKTPNIDRLAAEGARFRTAYTVPVCSPSRVLLMTGRYGFRTGWENFTGRPGSPTATNPDYDLGSAETTFAHFLGANGYVSGLAGRWLEYGHEFRQIPSAGFDEYMVWAIWGDKLPPGVKHTGAWERDSVTSRFWHPCLITDGRYVPTTAGDYAPDVINRYCRDFIRRHRDRPFVLFYPMILVHTPFVPVPDFTQAGKRKDGNLQSYIEYTDHLVGKLVDELDELGLRENTIVFFAGDNGTVRLGKNTPTERGARVPLIVRAPGIVKEAIVSDALTDFSDVFPTFADFAGVSLPEGIVFDGKSLAPVLRGKTTEHRSWIFSYLQDTRILRDKRWLLEGDRFFDCGDDRDGNYKDVTTSTDPEVIAARQRFEEILKNLLASNRPTDTP